MDITSKQEKPKQEMDCDRILRKRTLELGEVSSSDEETTVKAPKMFSTETSTNPQGIDFDKLFPNWWEEDQHLETCFCDFCVLFFGKTRPSIEPLISTALMPASPNSTATVSIDVETAPEPAIVETDLGPAPSSPVAA